jgi:hypothetical protein
VRLRHPNVVRLYTSMEEEGQGGKHIFYLIMEQVMCTFSTSSSSRYPRPYTPDPTPQTLHPRPYTPDLGCRSTAAPDPRPDLGSRV